VKRRCSLRVSKAATTPRSIGLPLLARAAAAAVSTSRPASAKSFSTPEGPSIARPASAPGASSGTPSAVHQLRAFGGQGVLFSRTSYTDPPGWYLYDPANGQTRETAMRTDSPVSFDTPVD